MYDVKKKFAIKQLKNYNPFIKISQQYNELNIVSVYPYIDFETYIHTFLFNALSSNIDEDEKKLDKHSTLSRRLFAKYLFPFYNKLNAFIDHRYGTWLSCMTMNVSIVGLSELIDLDRFPWMKSKREDGYDNFRDEEYQEYEYILSGNHPLINVKSKQELEDKLNNVFLRLKKIKGIKKKMLFSIKGIDEKNDVLLRFVDAFIKHINEIKTPEQKYIPVTDLFNFINNTEMHNVYGCLGLLLMDTFLTYYKQNNMRLCLVFFTAIDRLYNFDMYQKKNEKHYKKVIEEQEAYKEKKLNNLKKAGRESGKKRGAIREKGYEYWRKHELYKYKTSEALLKMKEFISKHKYNIDDKTITEAWFKEYRNRDKTIFNIDQ